MSIKDNPFLKLDPSRTAPKPDSEPNEIGRGADWIAIRRGDQIVLSYLMGEQGGGEREIAVTADEFAALQSGARTVANILIAYGR